MCNQYRFTIIKTVIFKGKIVGYILDDNHGKQLAVTIEEAINHHKMFSGLTNAVLRRRRTILSGEIEYLQGKRESFMEWNMLIDLQECLLNYNSSLDFLMVARNYVL